MNIQYIIGVDMKKICIALFCIGGVVAAQSQTNEPNLNRELTVEKEYTPNLHDVDKLNRLPDVKIPEAPKSQAEYSNYTLDCNIPPYFQAIKAKNYFTDFKTSGKRGYLDLGLGTLFNFNGDAGYQILNSSKNRLSVFASRRSNTSTVHYLQADEKGKMKINDNLVGVDFLHQFEKLKLTADAQYVYSGFNDYGLALNDFTHIQDQVNHRFQIHTGIESVHNSDVTYKANVAYSSFTQKHQLVSELLTGKENRILIDGDLFSKWLGLAGSIRSYFYNLPAEIVRLISLDDYKDYATISVAPYTYFEEDTWNAHLGLSFNKQVGEMKEFALAPDIRFNWRPADEFLLTLLATGGFKDNSNYNSHSENRYIAPYYRLRDTKIPLDASIHLAYSPVANFGIRLFAGNEWRRYDSFYYGIIPTVFDAHTSVFKWGGNLKYAYQDIVDVDWQIHFNHWKIQEEFIACDRPAFVSIANIGFKIPNFPLRFDLNYHLETGRKSFHWEDFRIVDMKNIHDLSLQAAYTLNPTVSFFAKANNLLFQKYDIWYGYPAQNFNFMAGASIKF